MGRSMLVLGLAACLGCVESPSQPTAKEESAPQEEHSADPAETVALASVMLDVPSLH
jgi:hypothetical protein